MKILQIPLKAKIGHFKVNYTTASKLSYDIPTFTVIEGIIGAIMGWNRSDYRYKIKRDSAKFGIIIRSPIQKAIYAINAPNELITPMSLFSDKKKSASAIKDRTQLYTELLIDPAYTILFSHNDENLYREVKSQVLAKKSVYNIYLGSAFCIAEYDGEPEEIEIEKVKITKSEVISVIDLNYVKEDINWDANTKMITDNIPYLKDPDLTIRKYKQVIYNPLAEPINCSGDFYHYKDNKYIYLFEGSE
ncbi:MAG: CRISPR-associated protein Cas5 [Candidatus Cloacimonas sp.]|nr:CRISPR-associated protein Cas5 [Candidatus Cloacimonas sp.]